LHRKYSYPGGTMMFGHQTLGDAVYRCAAYCRAAGAGTGELLVGAAAEYHRKE